LSKDVKTLTKTNLKNIVQVESGRTRQRGQRGLDNTAQEAGVQDQYSSDEDVWTTEDEDNDGNNSDSSQDECYASQSVGDNTNSKLRHVFIP